MVNPKLMEMAKRLGQGITPKIPEPLKIASGQPADRRIILLDESPADNSRKKEQAPWIKYWNEINDGRVMASMPDYYQVFKQLTESQISGTAREKEKAKKLTEIIRDSFQDTTKINRLISSTKIIYDKDSLNACMIHHSGCKDRSRTSEKILEISNIPLAPISFSSNATIERYLQALFETEDDLKIISPTLEYISGKKADHIYIGLPTLGQRKKGPKYAAVFVCFEGIFYIHNQGHFILGGCKGQSFGVRYLNEGKKE